MCRAQSAVRADTRRSDAVDAVILLMISNTALRPQIAFTQHNLPNQFIGKLNRCIINDDFFNLLAIRDIWLYINSLVILGHVSSMNNRIFE